MTRSDFVRLRNATETMKGTIEVPRLHDTEGVVVRVTNSSGDPLETLDFEDAMEWVCGPGKNRLVDSISGKRASIVGAIDRREEQLICRLCLVSHRNGGSRFERLTPRDLKVEVHRRQQTQCQCGRDLS